MKWIEKYRIAFIIVFAIAMFFKPELCLFILGSLVIYLSINSYLFLQKIRKRGISCTGRILSYESGRGRSKTPIVEFKPLEGGLVTEKPFIYLSTDLSKIRSYKKMIDKEVLILYNPDNPKEFVLKTEEGVNYFFLGFLILIGLVFLIVSICSFAGYIKLGE